MKKLNFDNLGMEAIDFQTSRYLHTALTASIQRLRGAATENDRQVLLGEMSAMIMTNTGLKIEWEVIKDNLGVAVLIEPLTQTHPIMYKIQQEMIAQGGVEGFRPRKIETMLSGTVDLKKSKVSGDFSKIAATIYLPKGVWESKTILPEEWAAVLLHELGHVFAFFEFLGYTMVTNMALMEVARLWMGSYPVEKRIEVLSAMEAYNRTSIQDKEALAKNDDPRVAATAIVASTVTKVRSELGTKWYDQRVFEFLADQFATRHGAGRYLVTGLDKLVREIPWFFRDAEFRSTSSMIVANLVKVALIASQNMPMQVYTRAARGAAAISTTLMTKGDVGAFLLFGIGGQLLSALMNDGLYRYDKTPDRFAATRREIVSSLKNQALPKDFVARQLDDLAAIDAIMGQMNKLDFIDKMLFNWLADSLTGSRRQAKLQQQYETLAHNALFERAAQLSTAGNV